MVGIGFEEIASYLRGSGWHRSLSGPFAEVWHPRGDDKSSVFVPKEVDSPDFLTSLQILTKEVSRFEKRPERDIRLEISRQFVDVTDLRAEDEGIADGTIPLAAGIGLFNSAHRMMVSAAAATLHRQSYYGNSMPRAAHRHARRMRLGQTRPGSYIVPVISSARFGALVSEKFGEPRLEATGDESYFERRMLTTLSRALETLSELTVARERTPSKLDVLSAVDEGVSSELCAAVLDVIGKGDVGAFDITFNWAPSSPAPRGLREKIEFPSAAADLIERIEFELKETDAPAERILYGVIRRLALGKNDKSGHVTLDTMLDGKPRTVAFDLPLDVYRRAANYHGERRPVIVRGFLDAPPGRRATMQVTAFEADRSVASFEDAEVEAE